MNKISLAIVCSFVALILSCSGTKQADGQLKAANKLEGAIKPGAFQTGEYVPLLKGKRAGIFANHTSTIGGTHLVDSLQKLGITITKIFGPEHGFRGTADAGEKVDSYIDKQTGIPVISLYGKKRKPTAEDLADVDVMVFDIQDVGIRFYTFISSLQEFMETAIEYNKPLIILDRPNPNGFYVDGPVLDTAFRSFVGMQPVPIVYGMTMGEYAGFLLGEHLLKNTGTGNGGTQRKPGLFTDNITIVKCKNYTHNSRYVLPEKPSPNLPDAASVFWYPSTCFFEGTVLSEGRGTEKPFQYFGHPALPQNMFSFTPVSKDGAKNPKLENRVCYGWNLSEKYEEAISSTPRIHINYLIEAYRLFPEKENFFIKPKKDNPAPQDYFFNKLAGNAQLMKQLMSGSSETEIRKSWEPGQNKFKAIRKKYLLYEDAPGL